MRICRALCRLLLSRSPHIVTGLKMASLFCIIVAFFLFVLEKQEKEALIDLALGSRVTDELVLPDNDTLILNGLKNVQSKSESDEKKPKIRNAFVVIVVTSLPDNLSRRNIIRKTWASIANDYGAVVVFFLGKPSSGDKMNNLIQEAQEYQDLMIDDFVESYYALSIKTLRIIKYFKFHHPKSKFLVKTDDDVFVNVPKLVFYCYSVNKGFEENGRKNDGKDKKSSVPDYFVGGVIHSGRGPHTWNPFSKWYAPRHVWKPVYQRALEEAGRVSKAKDMVSVQVKSDSDENDVDKIANNDPTDISSYPPYAEGNFYVLSSEAALDILNVSRTVPLYHLEDVHVTGVLATWMLNIDKKNMPFISSSSNFFPKLSYLFYKAFTASPNDLIAFHCDNHVELISLIFKESREE